MTNTVRNFILASAAVVAIAFTATSAMAESHVNNPFEFKVGNKTLPAGDYVVAQNLNHSSVQLISRDGTKSFSWVLEPGDPDPASTAVVLSFDVNGSTDWLRTIQYGPQTTPKIDPGSRRFEYSTLRVLHAH